MGEFHPAEKKVVVEFSPEDFGLTEVQQMKLRKLAGPRYNPEKETIKMSCESFEHQAQNKRYLAELVEKLITEAKVRDNSFNEFIRFRGIRHFLHIQYISTSSIGSPPSDSLITSSTITPHGLRASLVCDPSSRGGSADRLAQIPSKSSSLALSRKTMYKSVQAQEIQTSELEARIGQATMLGTVMVACEKLWFANLCRTNRTRKILLRTFR